MSGAPNFDRVAEVLVRVALRPLAKHRVRSVPLLVAAVDVRSIPRRRKVR